MCKRAASQSRSPFPCVKERAEQSEYGGRGAQKQEKAKIKARKSKMHGVAVGLISYHIAEGRGKKK
jgi:hypothetical protein